MMRIVLFLVILGILAGGAWYYLAHESAEIPLEELRESLPAPRSVSLERSYSDGIVTVEGEVSTVDACETAAANATLTASGSVLIAITIPATEGPCLARAGTTAFSAELSAPLDAPIEFLVNGAPATVTAP